MHFNSFSFGTLRIDRSTYKQDVVIDRGKVRKRKKAASREFLDEFGHTPLSIKEKIPWKCHRLVIGTGVYGRMPVMGEVKLEAERRHVELVVVPTSEALRLIEREAAANVILHVTCLEIMCLAGARLRKHNRIASGLPVTRKLSGSLLVRERLALDE
jgi:hypothetical protein